MGIFLLVQPTLLKHRVRTFFPPPEMPEHHGCGRWRPLSTYSAGDQRGERLKHRVPRFGVKHGTCSPEVKVWGEMTTFYYGETRDKP